jgi:hypothetical protein
VHYKAKARRPCGCRSQQPFVESPVGARSIDEMYFENPMPFATERIGVAHRLGIARIDARQILVAGNLRVGEFANQMPRDRTAKNPSGFFG